MKEMRIICALSEIMGRHRITQSALSTASGLRMGTIGALYHDRSDSVSKATLAKVLTGLHALTGESYHAGDLLRFSSE